MNRRSLLCILLLLGTGLIFFWNLGAIPLFDPDEGRYSEMSLTMLRTGDWMIPRMNGIIHIHKPPLANWLFAESFKIFGPSEFSARLPGVLLSLALLALLIRLGTFLFNFRTGYAAACILATSILYVAISRLVTTDMTLTFVTFSAMYCIAHLFFSDRRRLLYFYGAVIFLGLGMLTKGPVAWMITLTPTLVFAIWKKQKIEIPLLHWILGFLLFVLISLSWYVAVILTHEGVWDYFVHHQLVGRMFKGRMGRAHPIFYYLLIVPLGFFPWTFFLPAAWADRKEVLKDASLRIRAQFVLLWFLVPFILFSLFRTKLATYIVPVFPPLALYGALYWAHWLDPKTKSFSRRIEGTLWLLARLLPAMIGGGLIFVMVKPEFLTGIPLSFVAALLLLLTGVTFAVESVRKKGSLRPVFMLLVLWMSLMSLLALSALPYLQYKNSKQIALELAKTKKPGEKILLWGDYYASLPFYLQERVVEVSVNTETTFEKPEVLEEYVYEDHAILCKFFQGPERVYLVMSEERLRNFDYIGCRPHYLLYYSPEVVILSNRKGTVP